MDEQRLNGKTAIVTGAARGMGKATALTLAGEGASIIAVDIRPELLETTIAEAPGGQMRPYVADISDEAQVSAMVAATMEQFGTVDILVNNAGILRTTSPLETISLAEWQLMMTVNVTGIFLCTKAVLPIMKQRRSGKIINFSSTAGRSTSTFGGAHYTTSKAAVLGLTRHTAREAAPYNINVNAVAPGSIDTDMVRERAEPDFLASQADTIPLGRLGTAQDVANLVVFLCTEEASFISGATVDINGADLLL